MNPSWTNSSSGPKPCVPVPSSPTYSLNWPKSSSLAAFASNVQPKRSIFFLVKDYTQSGSHPSVSSIVSSASSPLPPILGSVKSLIVVTIDQSTSSDNAVQQILSLLANLEELGLAGDTRDSKLAFLDWGNDLRMGILELCSSDRLVKICLVHVSFPLSALGLAPRLETLKLRHVLFISDSELDHRTYGSGFGFEFRWYIMRKEKHPPARLKHVSDVYERGRVERLLSVASIPSGSYTHQDFRARHRL